MTEITNPDHSIFDKEYPIEDGIVNALPTDIARELGADIIIAFNVASPLRTPDNLELPWEIADQIITIMMQPFLKVLKEEADVLIEPNLGSRLPSDFTDLSDLILQGQIAAELSYGKIDSLLKNWNPSQNDTTMNLTQTKSLLMGQVSYSSVEILGTNEFTQEALLKASKRDYNQQSAMNPQDLSEDIIRHYRKAGYSLAEITDTRFNSINNSLEITINEGIISSIVVKGNTVTSKQLSLISEKRIRDWIIFIQQNYSDKSLYLWKKRMVGIRLY